MKTHRSSRLPSAGWLLLLVFAGGCATTREVSVDSQARPMASGEKKPQSYVIRAKPHANGKATELRDQEAVEHVKTALSAQGLYEAPNAELADLVVEVDYGIDPARVRYEIVKVPLYGKARPEIAVRSRRTASAPEVEGGGWGITTAPLGEYEEVPVMTTVREKHLTISGRENKPVAEGKLPPEVFRVSASIDDESPDLRASLPVLASAVMDQLGQTTDGTATAKVKEDGDAVKFIRRGM